MSRPHRPRLAAALALSAVLGVSACGGSSDSAGGDGSGEAEPSSSGSGGGGGSESGPVALLLPESQTTRYEAFDRPLFEQKLADLCPECELLYSNADQDASKQQAQADAALTSGAKVLVLGPVDGQAAQAIVEKAKAQDVPVVSYDRLASGPVDVYISFDNERVGRLQGEALLEALSEGGDPQRGQVVWHNGSPTDPNAALFKQGAHGALDGNVQVGAEYDTPEWLPSNAQNQMQQAITSIGQENIIGVYAANDGTAGGAIAAMKAAGFTEIPPVTGQDAELAAIQRILTGDQYMTVYKAIRPEAERAAELAYSLLQGEDVEADSEVGGIPAVLLDPVVVTKDNVADTVVADGFYSAEEICTGAVAEACAEAGIGQG